MQVELARFVGNLTSVKSVGVGGLLGRMSK
jgi:hypothetical protein